MEMDYYDKVYNYLIHQGNEDHPLPGYIWGEASSKLTRKFQRAMEYQEILNTIRHAYDAAYNHQKCMDDCAKMEGQTGEEFVEAHETQMHERIDQLSTMLHKLTEHEVEELYNFLND